jgi:hypothetical protein
LKKLSRYANNSQATTPVLLQGEKDISILSVLIVSSLTFVAYEGLQLVINAVDEMKHSEHLLFIVVCMFY